MLELRPADPVLFLHSADATNTNPQSLNSKAILARWPTEGPRAAVIGFRESALEVASNPAVDIWRVRPDRFWRLGVAARMQKRVSCIVLPGLHLWADWAGVELRRLTGRRVPIIRTVEALLTDDDDLDERAEAYSQAARHPVFCQHMSRQALRRRDHVDRDAEHFIAISPFLKKMIEVRHPGKASVVPLGVDLTMFHSVGRSSGGRPSVVSVASVRARKRPDIFLKLAERFPFADFAWYGEGNLRATLIQQAAVKGMRNLKFPGPLQPSQLAGVYRAADVFVLPSMDEGVPKVTQEAAACGLPQIVFGFYEAPTVIHGQNGLVVWNDDELATSLGTLLSDEFLRRRMGDTGAAMALNWSWDIAAPLWREQILKVIGQT